MKFSNLLVATTALGQCASANAVPNSENVALDPRSQESDLIARDLLERVDADELWKRKGGGGGGGRGGGGGSSSGGSRGGSGSTSGNRGGSGGGARPAPVFTGPRPAYGGGQYYGGGARQPYPAGRTSPGGIGPVGGLLIGGAIGFGAASWATGAYRYRHKDDYTFFNATTDKTETKPVECLCADKLPCGCEDNTDKKYLDSIIGNGSYAALNKTLVDVGPVDGKSTIRINGTLPEGTTAENVDGDDTSDAQAILQAAGWWPVITTGLFMAFIV